jgi:hypothetical protein
VRVHRGGRTTRRYSLNVYELVAHAAHFLVETGRTQLAKSVDGDDLPRLAGSLGRDLVARQRSRRHRSSVTGFTSAPGGEPDVVGAARRREVLTRS